MKIAKWVVIPQDVLDRLTDVHSTQESAQKAALERCGKTGAGMAVAEIQAYIVKEGVNNAIALCELTVYKPM